MRVLIVKISALGDVTHALPVLSYLSQVSPGIEIDWVVEASFTPLLEGNPHISMVIPVSLRSWRSDLFSTETLRAVRGVVTTLRERRYDIVFDIQGNIKSGVVAWLTGSPRRYGFDEGGVREYPNLWFTTNHVPLRTGDHHVTDRALRVVSTPFGRDFRTMHLHTDIVTTPADDETAAIFRAVLTDGPVILFHPGTTWETKKWHVAGWIELGKRIIADQPDATIVFSWGNDDEMEVCQQIIRGVGRAARLLPRLSLGGYVAFLKQVDLAVGPDTGPIHMAAAVGTPTVSLYRATDGLRNAPRGEHHRFVQAPVPCTRCLRTSCDRDRVCRESVTAGMLFDACRQLLPQGG